MFDQRLLFMFVLISVLEVEGGGEGASSHDCGDNQGLLGVVMDQFVPS